MGMLSRLFGLGNSPVVLAGLRASDDEFDIVGESDYQAALGLMAGGKTEEGVDHECDAQLVPERGNPYDANAVAVKIEGETIGYLSRENATVYRQRMGKQIGACEARIVGGWSRKRGRGVVDAGHFGVKLAIAWPPRKA